MTALVQSDEGMIKYFTSLNVPKSVSYQLSESILHWQRHHGMEFTVARLKNLKTQFIHFKNGSKVTLVKSHTDLSPVGSFRYFWKSRLPIKDILQCLNIYTSYISPSLKKGQVYKFVDSVNFIGPKSDFKFSSISNKVIVDSFHSIRLKHPLGWIRATGKRAPVVRDGIIKNVPENSIGSMDLITDFNSVESNRTLLNRHAKLISRTLMVDEVELRDHINYRKGGFPDGNTMYSELIKPPLIGSIGLIQERGMKLRAVANPNRLIQHVLSPIGDFIYGIIKRLEWDCTFDQNKGIDFGIQALREGKTIYSFDLSNATDRFPLNIQIKLMKDLIERLGRLNTDTLKKQSSITQVDLLDSLKLLETCSRGRWQSLSLYKEGFIPEPYLQWKTGQPLGLYPSFGLFALTHGMLVHTICEELGRSTSFRILGDDIIITDGEVALKYRETLNMLGCSISEHKSIVSNKYFEFAGKLVDAQGIIKVEKWKEFSLNNPLGPIHCLGLRGLKFVPSQYRKKVKLLMSLPKPYGLEINPDGIPLEDRVVPIFEKMYSKHGDVLTDYTLSYSDQSDLVSGWWQKVVTDVNGKSTYTSLPRFCPRIDDQSIPTDRIKIEHYNAHIMSLKGWETNTVPLPSVDKIFPNRDIRYKSKPNNLFSILKYFRGNKESSS